MKILVAQPGPAFSVHDVYIGWCEALRDAGQQVARYNLDERLTFYGSALVPDGAGGVRQAFDSNAAALHAVDGLCAQLFRMRPDVLLVVSGFFVPAELLDLARASGVRVVVVHTESPYEDARQVELAGHADLNLINDPTNLDGFRAVAPTWYLPHAHRPSVHHPGDPVPEMVCDFGFVGTGYPSRVDFLERMGLDGLDVLLAGNWQTLGEDSPLRGYVGHDLAQCLDNDQTADLYRSARSGINLYRRETQPGCDADGWAMGPREVEMAACGLFFLRDRRPEGDEVLSMLPTFSSPEEAGELLRWWLSHEDARHAAAGKAGEAVADRTFDRHAAELLRLLDQQRRTS